MGNRAASVMAGRPSGHAPELVIRDAKSEWPTAGRRHQR